jgi:hypothetical protein
MIGQLPNCRIAELKKREYGKHVDARCRGVINCDRPWNAAGPRKQRGIARLRTGRFAAPRLRLRGDNARINIRLSAYLFVRYADDVPEKT